MSGNIVCVYAFTLIFIETPQSICLTQNHTGPFLRNVSLNNVNPKKTYLYPNICFTVCELRLYRKCKDEDRSKTTTWSSFAHYVSSIGCVHDSRIHMKGIIIPRKRITNNADFHVLRTQPRPLGFHRVLSRFNDFSCIHFYNRLL